MSYLIVLQNFGFILEVRVDRLQVPLESFHAGCFVLRKLECPIEAIRLHSHVHLAVLLQWLWLVLLC